MNAGLLRVAGLSVRFGMREVVRDVGFTLPAGGSLGIVGESGSGKSLSVAALAGLAPPNARIAGVAIFDGIDLRTASERELATIRGRQIGFVFQDALSALNPFMRIGRQIAEGMRHHLRLDRHAVRCRVAALLEEVGLVPAATYLSRYPHQLSGGQRQRVAFAMAIACDPVLLIADEPTSALDVTIQAQILALLDRLRRRRGLSLVLISHDLSVVERICEDLLVMRDGEIVERGSVAAVFATPRHAFTRALLAARRPAATPRRAAAISGTPALRIERLQVSYALGLGRGHVQAVRDVSLEIGPGESLGLVGESGSGKSTVARAIVGLATACGGRIAVFGEDPFSARDRRGFARRCQIVLQDPAGALNPRLLIADALAEPLVEHALCPRTRLRATCERLLAEVGLSAEYLQRYPHQLSGGQRQRVVIARALALDPALLVCDEPVSALDVTVQRQILDLLVAIRARRHLAILFISHDLAAIRVVCERIAVMKDGRIVETGDSATILAAPAHVYTRQLIDAAPALS